MTKMSTYLAVGLLSVALAGPLPAEDDVYRSAHHDYRLVTVVDGLERPWSIAFLPGGDMLVTEQPGRLRIVRDGRLLPDPVAGVPAVHFEGQGGLLEVVPHPDFEANRLLYLSYSKPAEGERGPTTAIARGRFENDALSDVEDIFIAVSEGRGHYGSRLAFDAEGYLFATIGDRQAPPRGELESHPAQDRSNHHGVTVRLHDDGSVPADNPFVGEEGVQPEIYSWGHRNAQGMIVHPETGGLWQTEHGPQGGDEVNVIEPGANYGWPVVGYGVNYRSGSAIHAGTMREGMEHPLHVWIPSIGASGLTLYTGDAFPGWRGDLLAGGLSGRQLARLDLDATERSIGIEESLAWGVGRIRDVRQGPDGLIYLAIDPDDEELTPILRMEPVEEP